MADRLRRDILKNEIEEFRSHRQRLIDDSTDDISKKLDRLYALVDPEGFLIEKVRDRPVGVSTANGLLNR